MALGEHENQLELFDLANQPAAKMRRETFGRLLFHLRYDQAMFLGIGALLGLTVIFAFGVERGKRLVRSEAFQVARQVQPSPVVVAMKPAPSKAAEPAKKPAATQPASEAAQPEASNTASPASIPATTPKAKPKTRVAGASRYAIQVATYSRPQLAKQELERLRAGGESGFIVIRNGRTVVYAGPFPSRDNASEKLVGLRQRYLDCFIKTL